MTSARNIARRSTPRRPRSSRRRGNPPRSIGKALKAKGLGPITTEIAEAGPFYFAEGYHQQYLAKNPGGYCGLGGTGVSCPIGVGAAADAS